MTTYGNLAKCNFNKKKLSSAARHTALLCSRENEYIQFCRETFALSTYGFDLFNFLVSRSSPCSDRTAVSDSDGRKQRKKHGEYLVAKLEALDDHAENGTARTTCRDHRMRIRLPILCAAGGQIQAGSSSGQCHH